MPLWVHVFIVAVWLQLGLAAGLVIWHWRRNR